MNKLLLLATASLAAALATPASAEMQRYSVIFGGKNVGHLNADVQGSKVVVDYDFKNNAAGRP